MASEWPIVSISTYWVVLIDPFRFSYHSTRRVLSFVIYAIQSHFKDETDFTFLEPSNRANHKQNIFFVIQMCNIQIVGEMNEFMMTAVQFPPEILISFKYEVTGIEKIYKNYIWDLTVRFLT